MNMKLFYLLAALCMLCAQRQVVGQGNCDALINGIWISIDNVVYTQSDTIYAVKPGLVVGLVIIPAGFSTVTTCQRHSNDGTITDCGITPECTGLFCMIMALDAQAADQLIIQVKNSNNCSDWIYTLYVSGLGPLQPFYAVEGSNVTFPWIDLLNFTWAKWFRGDVNENLLMTYAYDSGDVLTEVGQQVEYIQGTYSVGMILRNADINATDQYSVLLNISGTVLDKSSTNLIMISVESYQTFLSQVLMTVNNVSSYYGEVVDAVDPGQLVIEVTLPDDYGQTTLIDCSIQSVLGLNDSCGSCTALSCQFTLVDAMPWDIVTISFQVETLQSSPLTFVVVVKGLTPQPEVTALEGCDVILTWNYHLQYERVEWYQGDIENGTLLMTYTPSSGNISVEAGFEIKPSEADDSIGLVIPGVTTEQNGTYTAVVYVTEQARERTSTELNVISAEDFENYAKSISLNVSDMLVINYGQMTAALEPGDLNVTVAASDVFPVANMTCTVLRADNSSDDCGLCNATVCQFSVIDADMGDRIIVSIWMDSIQCASVEFNLIIAGIPQIPTIRALSGCAVHFPWIYPGSYYSVEWIDADPAGEVSMMSYIPATNDLTVNSTYDVEYINASNSIGMILSNPKNGSEYKVRVSVTQFTQEESTTLYQEEDATQYEDFKSQMAGSKPVLEPGSQTISVNFSNDTNYNLNITCMLVSPDETSVSCGSCDDDTCQFTVTGGEADKVEIGIDVVNIQCSSFGLTYFFKGISDLGHVSAIEYCDTSLPWLYPAKFEKAEWFAVANSSEDLLMTYEYSGNVTVADTNVEYINGNESIGMIVHNASSPQYAVKLTLSPKTTEESQVNMTYIPDQQYQEFRGNSSIQINNGPMLNYGESIDEIDAGNVDLVINASYSNGNVTMTCTRITKTGTIATRSYNNGTFWETSVQAEELDTISIVIELVSVQCSSFEFKIKVKEAPRTTAACGQASLSNVILFLAVVWIANWTDV